ncbi:LRR receptor-like serine/threonine-protein kinase [Pyrus ussuriensis x Pyrus communis]|uniref:LRR receptor-like serine/threonine-protein kinase n=1 Tax=Pyrus ussuriensis x Pyrus communis TaxID=2448454 RepID=A0A5N5H8N7_9ROSA|nr:LRR receptor-like serine/threonine-protein kinase [Pyrus ussuriensis x Pyrus communis]
MAHSYKDYKSGVSYPELLESTNGFSVDNLIGSGSFDFVYKGVLPSDRMIVAVKVLNLHQQGAYESFFDECKALRSIRHQNLLQIITACSSMDNQGNGFKGLVFKFMKNESLDSWLHPKDEQSQIKRLSTVEKLNIAIDTYRRHVQRWSKHSQICSYSVACHVMNVVDPSLLLETDGDGDNYDETYGNNIQERPITRYCDRAPLHATRFEECLVSVMQIGISCSAMSPRERMPIAVVVNQMKTIRDDGKF